MRIHAFQTGRLTGNRTFLRSERFASMLRPSDPFTFPVLCFVLEHPDGLIAIDAGMVATTHTPRWQRRFAPVGEIAPEQEIGPRMRAAGLDCDDVRLVILTHLDWDHVGGIGHFAKADALVHRPEWAFGQTFMGRQRFQASRWSFSPSAYDLDGGPFGPFAASRVVAGGITLVPLPGHSPGQVGVVVEDGGRSLLFCADHVLSQAWYEEDRAAGRRLGLGIWDREAALDTSRRVDAFVDGGGVLLPSHDPGAPARLAAPVLQA